MKQSIRILFLGLIITSFLCSCGSHKQPSKNASSNVVTIKATPDSLKPEVIKAPKNDLGSLPKIAGIYSRKINSLLKEQSECTDVEKMFAFDSIIASAKMKANMHISHVFDSLKKPVIVYFSQTKNNDSIKIKEVRMLRASYDVILLEATVEAVRNSVFNMPFTSLSIYDSTGKHLDIGGGIGIENKKLKAGKTYIFKGQMDNVSKLKPGFKMIFNEEMKKW
jgi:hypothetical protein